MATNPTDYEHDFYTWTFEQARRLREGGLSDIDREHIAEELEDMGRSLKRALGSELERLLAHLLKWRYQPQGCGNSWLASMRDARTKIRKLLQMNPGLKVSLAELYADAYEGAINWAVIETDQDPAVFPAACPWTQEQALDKDYWPE